MWPASTVKNIANLIFFIIKSRKKQNADDKNIIKNNPIFHSLTLQICRIPYIYAAGTKKNRNEQFVPLYFAENENRHLHITQFHVTEKFQDLNVFTAPEISNALQLVYKARKFKLAIQAEQKQIWMALQVMCSLWI